MQNVAKFRLIVGLLVPQPSTYEWVAYMSTFSISAQYVRMGLKEPLMQKSCPKWLFWVYLDANKHFSLQMSTKLYQDSDEIFLRDKNYVFWKMTPGYPT